ncbi:DMT family transporter [Polyangium sp. 15x6]|uniref:DMT family transporter n=1 Tax=Polyangium sp. 15x6 TaxID=3042687 RepID=UPI00249CE4C3|nr:DMT family transporter [Polyangium sp. 15x6]MDI3291367.1 DMT family transporter [Polyangium sp. 15x6]
MSFRLYLLLVLVPLTAAGNLIAGKFALRSFSPSQANALRYLLALVVLLPMLRRWPRPTRKELAMLAATGLLGICVYNLLFFEAMRLIPLSEAALLEMTIPAASLALARGILRERISLRQVVGVVVSFAGALWLLRILPPGASAVKTDADWRGEALMLLSVACFAVYSIISKLAMQRLPPPAVATWSCLWGTVPLLLLSVPSFLASRATLGEASLESWLGVLYGSLIGFVFNIIAWYYCFREAGVAKTNTFLYLVPIFGALLAMMIFGERLTGWQVFGAGVTFGGVLLATLERKPVPPLEDAAVVK